MNLMKCVVVASLLIPIVGLVGEPTDAAEKVRVYAMGENDDGASVGTSVDETTDSQEPPTENADGDPVFDNEGDFVPLLASGLPVYVEGRDGEGSLAIDFNGDDAQLSSGPFVPQNFSTFAALSQAWVKADSAGEGDDQFLWSLGPVNGGVGITADGFWQMRASSGIPDTTTDRAVDFDEWTHVAVFRGGNSGNLFINGEQVFRGEATWGGGGPVTVGTGQDGENPFDGVLDDFNIAGFSDFDFDPVRDIDFFDPDNFSGIPGDVDQDSIVDQDDYLIWSQNVGFDNELGGGDAISLLKGDVDGNGRINYFDFQIISEAAAAAGNQLQLVPEPTSGGLFMLGALIVFSIRRRRR